jgi:hypothetical protein
MLVPNGVPIIERAIPEVHNSVGLRCRLYRISKFGLPGFIIRFAQLENIGAVTNRDVANVITGILTTDSGYFGTPTEIQVVGGLPENNKQGSSELHHDMFGGAAELRVHRTKSGSGKVLLGNHGTIPIEELEAMLVDSISPWALETIADELLLRDKVDPRIMSPIVYTAMLQAGDTVVFPTELTSSTHEFAGPVWHSFSTSSLNRTPEALALQFE